MLLVVYFYIYLIIMIRHYLLLQMQTIKKHSWVRLRLFCETNWTVHRTVWCSGAARERYRGKGMFRGKIKGPYCKNIYIYNLPVHHCSNEPALCLSMVNHIKNRSAF